MSPHEEDQVDEQQVPTPRDAEVPDAPELLEQAVYGDEAPAGRVVGLDPHDFAGLYMRHRASFAGQARRFLRDPRDVDEVVQEAFLRLFLALPELGTELQAIAYCRRTITNLCIDRYRADQRRPRLLGLESAPAEALLDDEPADPVVQAEDAAVVREALARLQPLHREALVKREIEEKPLPVIAAELDVPEESVKHLLFRARRSLRRLLAGSTADPAALVRLAAGSGGKLGVLIALVVMGLGSGPDLRVVPVVGKGLPDLPSVAEVVTKRLPAVVAPPAPEAEREVEQSRTAPAPAPSAPLQEPRREPKAPVVVVPAPVAPVVPTAPAATPAPAASSTPSAATSAQGPAVLLPSAQPSAAATAAPSAAATPSATPAATPPGGEPERPRPGTAVVGGSPTPSAESSSTPSSEPSQQPEPSQESPSPTASPRQSAPVVFPGTVTRTSD